MDYRLRKYRLRVASTCKEPSTVCFCPKNEARKMRERVTDARKIERTVNKTAGERCINHQLPALQPTVAPRSAERI